MGSGKTTVGRMIAKRLGFDFKDTDELITGLEGRSIPDIFKESGEPYFRDLETGVLGEIVKRGNDRIVLSTGGGLPVAEKNRPLLKAAGTVVYLRASAQCLNERVGNDDNRPLLEARDRLARIQDMLRYRGPIYEECADIVIDTDSMSAEETVDAVLKHLTN